MNKKIIIWVVAIIILLVVGFSLIGKKDNKPTNENKAQNENQNTGTLNSGAENEITEILNDVEETESDDSLIISEESIISAPSE